MGNRWSRPIKVLIGAAVILGGLSLPGASPARAQEPEGPVKLIEVFAIGGQSNAHAINVELTEQTFEDIIGPDTENRSIAVFKKGSLGTSITDAWKGDGTASTDDDGYNYVEFQERLHAFLTDLRAENPDHEVRLTGMWWHQGEGDTRVEYAVHYEENLTTLLRDIRVTFDAPDFDFITARLKDVQKEGWQLVRDAQTAVGDRHLNAYTVDIDDLSVHANGVHYTATGYAKIIERFVTTYAEVTRDWPTCGTYMVESSECIEPAITTECVRDQPTIKVEATTLAEDESMVRLVVDGTDSGAEAVVDSLNSGSLSTGPVEAGIRHLTITGNDALVFDDEITVEACEFTPGDVDGSASLDAQDVVAVLRQILGGPEPTHGYRADLDGSGDITLKDAMLLAQVAAPDETDEPGETGDTNEPGETGDTDEPGETGDTDEPGADR